MKNILIIAICLLASCSKDKECYQCYSINTYTNVKTQEPNQHCGWTSADASAYSSRQTSINTFEVGGTTYYRRTICAPIH